MVNPILQGLFSDCPVTGGGQGDGGGGGGGGRKWSQPITLKGLKLSKGNWAQ